ncbi:MAG: HD-GYP domain-containing protein, partial [Chloroflexi bacterium]|nr:HD-GYP domain-containing protein [Chloroflexota bacterium]
MSAAVRLAVFLAPIAASLVIAALLSRALPRADSALSAALWIGVVVLGSLATLVLFERGARRLLPLAALLNISLVFPDKAPARFAVARQTGSPADLRRRLEEARATGHTNDAQGMQTVVELVLALSVHDKGTRGHSERVRVFTDLIADELKIDESGQARLRWAALLHDVGKLEVPATILTKRGKPDDTEWAVLHRHPEEGARLVAPLLPWLGEWGRAVEQHHERWDGEGYPHGLKGTEICLAARIVSVADTYEVMTAPRPYKLPMSVKASRQELIRVAGTQLDPIVVRAFLNISVGRLWRAIGFGAWIAQIPALSRLFSGFGRLSAGLPSGAAATAIAGMLAVGSLSGTGLIGRGHPVPAGPPATSMQQVGPQTDGGSSSPGWSGASPSSQSRPSAGPLPSGSSSSPAPTPRSGGQGGQLVSGGSSGTEPSPRPTPTPIPTSTPTATPTSTPTPPTPTPQPASTCTPNVSGDPCNNSSAACTSWCNNNNLTVCTQYCEGNNNVACLSYCYGNNNKACQHDCHGSNNPICTQNCYRTDASAAQLHGNSATIVLFRAQQPPPGWRR